MSLTLIAVKCVYNAFNELTGANGCLQHMCDFTAPSPYLIYIQYHKNYQRQSADYSYSKPSVPLVFLYECVCSSVSIHIVRLFSKSLCHLLVKCVAGVCLVWVSEKRVE